MTAKKAIEFLRIHFEYLKERWKPYPDYNVLEAIRFAISAIEKQIPKKPIRHTAWEDFKCPTCGSTEIRPYDTEYREYDKDCEFEYCSDCGQKLDWSDEE